VRPSELIPQLASPADRRALGADDAFLLIVRGLFKKVVLASFLATALADGVFARPEEYTALEALVGVYAFAAQLYCDFSGYSDIAIGSASLLGFRIPENFNRPYAAQTVTEFWSRWHITLTRWLRDFLFTPLARRSSRSTAATCGIVLVVMLAAGLWHGAAWTFVAFGAIHGLALAGERYARERGRRRGTRHRRASRGRRIVGQLLTFHVVCLGWVFFRSESLAQAGNVLARIGSGWRVAAAGVAPLTAVTIVAVLAAQHLPARFGEAARRGFGRATLAGQAAALATALMVIDVLGPPGVPPFVYFRF
jgi:D-alanyl-lipoteichoic acid acyltransferase DltB (MBOAT superfamily)